MNRYLTCAAVISLLAGPYCFSTLLTSFGMRDRISLESFRAIRLGMTLHQVEAIMQTPGIDCASLFDQPPLGREAAAIELEGDWSHLPDDNDPGRRWQWTGDDAIISIRVNPASGITDKMVILLKPRVQ